MPDRVPTMKGGAKIKKVPSVKPNISMSKIKKGVPAKTAVPKVTGVKAIAKKKVGKRKPAGLNIKGRTKPFITPSNNAADTALAQMRSPEIYP